MGVLKETYCQHYSPSLQNISPTYPKTDCVSRIDDDDRPGFCKRPDNYRCVKEAGVMKLSLSNSSIMDFLTCPYLYYLKNIRGIRINNPHVSRAIKMGRLWDTALQYILGGADNMKKDIGDYEIGDFEIAKVRALYRAYKALEVKTEPGYELQYRFNVDIQIPSILPDTFNMVNINGVLDRKYPTFFAENKLSSKPDNYLDVFSIQSQIGAYFLADQKLEKCVMEVIRTPDLKSTLKYKEEGAGEHEERTYQDIISRPSFYFIGWDKAKKTYGKTYYRSEFNLEEIAERFRIVSVLMGDCTGFDGWYKNDRSCTSTFGQCEMKPICRYDTMSEEVYKVMGKPKF